MEEKNKNQGTIFYIDDDGRQKSTFFNWLDRSHPSTISFTTINSTTIITLPVTRLLKIKQNGDVSE